MNKKNITIVIILFIIGLLVILWTRLDREPGELDGFAQCLEEKGATFYGTFWCSHCISQKTLFGKSKKFLPYVECSTADRKSQLKVCRDKNIEGYPTWEFADGSRLSGEISLKQLSEKTGCSLP